MDFCQLFSRETKNNVCLNLKLNENQLNNQTDMVTVPIFAAGN